MRDQTLTLPEDPEELRSFGGQTLVSLLAVLVNPVTLVAGIGALTWLRASKSGDIAHATIASRIAVLLAMSVGEAAETGHGLFLNSMRSLTRTPQPAMAHLSSADRRAFCDHAAFVLGRLGKSLGTVAGVPPAPWTESRVSSDAKLDLTLFVASVVAEVVEKSL